MTNVTFKNYSQGRGVLFPPIIESMMPRDSSVCLINHIVDELGLR
ncbi:MAG: hypothetical protein H6Q19_265 [Bacteroidetes bacterium]|nr:hypothetical protein [Bacteroidota bacterium]